MIRSCLLLILLSGILVAYGAPRTKIACVGNSITYGSGIGNREKNSYPAQLQAILGTDYEVRNFGVSGRTLLSKGDLPYIKTQEYQNVLTYNPDIIFIKLGTNDSKLRNRGHLGEFISDYKALISKFQSLSSHPRIILLTPLPAFTQPDTTGITASVISGRILPMTEQVAYETGLEIIHLYPLFINYEGHVMPDKIHPSAIGAGVIAKRLFESVKQQAAQPEAVKFSCFEDKKSNFYGYECHSFKFQGADCKVVQPKRTTAGAPWIWRARFWGHEPQTDVALLDRGFHLAYCDVADLFGSPEAVNRWNLFYKEMQKAGLSSKVALEGMSRGGLIIYNWAAVNPEKVACVYADAPVLDVKSWPMGNLNGKRSQEDVTRMLAAYGFKDEAEALDYRKNPLDQVKKIAKGGFPMLHVCGDADDVVPVAENTNLFEQGILKNGGKIKVIHKPGIGHHPHSLKDPSKIITFILKATGYAQPFTTIAIPGNEYRSGAGWKEGSDWWANHEEISRILQTKQTDILLIGNSITQGFRGSRSLVTHNPGQASMNSTFPGASWESAGISGDRTENVLFRIQNGNYGKMKPKNVFLTIGVNNLYAGTNTAEETAAGIVACTDALIKEMPDSKITVFCTLPTGLNANSPTRLAVIEIGKFLSKELKSRPVKYVNLYDIFTESNGKLKDGCYSGDGIHLTTKGYEVWCNEIKKVIGSSK